MRRLGLERKLRKIERLVNETEIGKKDQTNLNLFNHNLHFKSK